ncbi:hypothetical protein TSAR_005599, partial [Trichomalopsis sarcophagae]
PGQRIAALDQFYLVQQLERDRQLLDVSRSVIEASQTQNITKQFVISRLKGKARKSLESNTFQTLAELKKHLRDCFAPSRSYGYYLNEIQTASMRKGENVRRFFWTS